MGRYFMFTIVIPFFNGHEYINNLIESIPSDIPIVVVDDHSDVPLTSLPYRNVKIIKASKKGYFTGAVNVGIQATDNDILVLNQDTYFTGSKWLDQLKNALDSGFAYIGERIKGTRPDFPNGYIHGTFMYITRKVINEVGLLNEKHYPLWGSTAEYQLRVARAGFKVNPIVVIDDFVHQRKSNEQFGSSIQTLLQREPENRKKMVQTPPLVSVVIPTHNFTQWMQSTVNSLVGGQTDLGEWKQQTFGGFEVVIVDDSSTDDTPEILADIVDPWKGVRSIRLDRPRDEVWCPEKDRYIGKTEALNAGIKSAYGKYILVIDADDMMHSDRIERFVDAIEADPSRFVYDNFQFFGNGDILEHTFPEYDFEIDTATGNMRRFPNSHFGQTTKFPKIVGSEFNLDVCKWKNQVHFSIMFRKDKWAEIGGYHPNFKYGRDDWSIAINFALNANYCGNKLNDYHGLLYRREGQNRTLVNTHWEWMRYFQSMMVHTFPRAYEGERHMACCGKGRTSRNNTLNSQVNNLEIASEGTSLVEYVGRRSTGERFTEYGFYTGTQYRVRAGTPFMVDNRDLIDKGVNKQGILQKFEADILKYRLVEEEPEPEPVVEEVEEPVVISVVQESETLLDEFAMVEEDYQPSTTDVELDYENILKTLTSFKVFMDENEPTQSELLFLQAKELDGKNRKTVLNRLDDEINS